MRGIVVALLAVTGCDYVLGLEQRFDAAVVVPADAQLDAIPTMGNAPACWGDPSPNDEDGDGANDGCDNCPGLENTLQNDRDTDGIGDACDPHPSFAIERLAFFHAFTTDPMGTEIGAGLWTQVVNGGGLVRQSEPNPTAQYLLSRTQTYRKPTVEIRNVNIQRGTTGASGVSGVWLVADPANADMSRPDGLACRGVFKAVTDVIEIVRFKDTVAVLKEQDVIAGTALPITYTLHATGPLGEIPRCEVYRGERDADTNPASATIQAAPDEPERFGVGLYTQNLSAEFRCITVYETIWPPI